MIDLSELNYFFVEKLNRVLDDCRDSGYEMRVFSALRTPFEQARLWRQSRSRSTIDSRVNELNSSGAGFLAHCIEVVGPQRGRWVTNAIPGLSWHQWGVAADCFWMVGGDAEWSTDVFVNGINGYAHYAEIAKNHGLTILKNDPVHVQYVPKSSPLADPVPLTLKQVNDNMEHTFGHLLDLGGEPSVVEDSLQVLISAETVGGRKVVLSIQDGKLTLSSMDER